MPAHDLPGPTPIVGKFGGEPAVERLREMLAPWLALWQLACPSLALSVVGHRSHCLVQLLHAESLPVRLHTLLVRRVGCDASWSEAWSVRLPRDARELRRALEHPRSDAADAEVPAMSPVLSLVAGAVEALLHGKGPERGMRAALQRVRGLERVDPLNRPLAGAVDAVRDAFLVLDQSPLAPHALRCGVEGGVPGVAGPGSLLWLTGRRWSCDVTVSLALRPASDYGAGAAIRDGWPVPREPLLTLMVDEELWLGPAGDSAERGPVRELGGRTGVADEVLAAIPPYLSGVVRDMVTPR